MEDQRLFRKSQSITPRIIEVTPRIISGENEMILLDLEETEKERKFRNSFRPRKQHDQKIVESKDEMKSHHDNVESNSSIACQYRPPPQKTKSSSSNSSSDSDSDMSAQIESIVLTDSISSSTTHSSKKKHKRCFGDGPNDTITDRNPRSEKPNESPPQKVTSTSMFTSFFKGIRK
mmetsp:Transcript_17360/g.20437  ORF Transcript_17360/g.20437 Transcript_17360/m.20437 type:complete len:176 (-) Transcript_17360:24-551(-)